MSKIQLQLIRHQTADGLPYGHLRIHLPSLDGIIEPEDLKGLKLPEGILSSQGVVIEGRGPIWLYGYLVHECHATAWVGCYDPRLEGAVVVETHTRQVSVGSIVQLTLPH
ncbi:MAG TPA: CRISPR-associated protein Csx3 [Cyanobacteria bacterium UBA8803]|nr:CRISPR-associated protein Csx3 [Cyanobacteria bacterium UBA9273]HBL62280.1 CRISPR-associated protein Csx3 [Cyanobacteria bacterium UBA8803]